MRKKRLKFAKDHLHFKTGDWEKITRCKSKTMIISLQVYFSDEVTLHCLTESGRNVRSLPKEKFHPECIQIVVKHPPSVMVWGSISGDGPGPYFLEDTMRQNQYLKVLNEILVPYIEETRENFKFFMQDNAPCHTAKIVKKNFE